MTRSKLIAMLQTSATSLNALGNKAPPTSAQPGDPADSQVASTILQLILQLLEAILAEKPTAGQALADFQQENTALMHALTDTLAGIHLQGVKDSTGGTVDIGGVQINVLQIIIQIILTIMQNTGTTKALAPAMSDEVVEPEAIQPRVTSDSITYAIDTLGRLTKLTYASGHTITFNYDAVGNRTSVVTT